ncbi:exopolyphosphatase PRUNE1 isoform X2 [Thrips palmi]|uniref:Exopolyphosphatase PRUNE1 isoform X2 n=1 Tax=Thrips palmi TaxID=161013 RepID=A0A6P9A265_THRPL|nr:exopolyphosphatase PRUNE1 isoform X2 [Thrips palmi]
MACQGHLYSVHFQLMNHLTDSPASLDIIHIILGNESCDLDSVVSALCLGLLMHSQGTRSSCIPVLNIPREEYALKTEVTYFLSKNGISEDLLTFRDEVDLAALHAAGRLRLTLVDHHALPERDRPLYASLASVTPDEPSAVAVLDHRPRDAVAAAAWPRDCEVVINVVGSCASLVGERILALAPELFDAQVADLIRGTVLLDTACFSAQADRTTPSDTAIVSACEERGTGHASDRSATFEDIIAARKDVSELTALQILHKDMKVVRGLPLPGMPLLVQDFLQRADAAEALAALCAKHLSDAAVVMGMSFSGEASSTLRRDIAVYSAGGKEQPAKTLVEALQKDESLQLVERPCALPGVSLFDQRNTKCSRKQVLPLVQAALSA